MRADRPIIFSGPMVRAILDGRKSQTRRLATSPLRKVQPGDRLYVRETFVTGWKAVDDEVQYTDEDGKPLPEHTWYRADGDLAYWVGEDGFSNDAIPWRPSIHMPRSLSRLTLIVTEVRQQRLQEISEEDAIAEGAVEVTNGWSYDPGNPRLCGSSAYGAYWCLWSHLHGSDSWDKNPDVIAISFSVRQANIDALGEEAA